MTWSTAIFRSTVGDAMSPLPPILPAGTECALAVSRMAALGASCLLIVDNLGRPAGMLTEQDVVRRVAFQMPAGTPVDAAMTRAVPSVAESGRLYRALSQMRRQRHRHLVVIDAAGRAVGILELDVALGAVAQALTRRMDRLSRDLSIDGLAQTKASEPAVAGEMLADGVPAPEIQAFLTEINRDLYRHVLDRALAAMADEGWGGPPVPFCVLIMGSGGRGENYLDPDQDNGFILGDYPDASHPAMDRFFVELAERMCRDLDTIGIPYCPGGVMATSPVWRKTLPQWLDQVAGWGRRWTGGATLMADIFFDFQPVFGDAAMAAELRRRVSDMPRRNRGLLHSMARDDTAQNVALGLFGRLVTQGPDSVNRGRIELKLHGTQPLVGCARLLALAAGIEETSTLGRLHILGERGILSQGDIDQTVAACHHVARLRLSQQVADIAAGRPPGDYVDVAALTQQDRDLLADALRAIDRLRKRAQMDLAGQPV